jgi:hypothetical protein
MAVPVSGELKLWNDIWNDEIGGTQGQNSLHSASVYAGFTTPDAMSDFYGWSDVSLPAVTTNSMSSITTSTMVANGNVTNTGNGDTNRGFYFGTNSETSTSNTKYDVSTSASTGTYNRTFTGLPSQSTRYAWAYACNSAGQVIGGRVQAATAAPPFTPTYGTVTIVGLSCNRSSVGAGCIGDGARGFAYLNPYGGYVGRVTTYQGSVGGVTTDCQVTNATNLAYFYATYFSPFPWSMCIDIRSNTNVQRSTGGNSQYAGCDFSYTYT